MSDTWLRRIAWGTASLAIALLAASTVMLLQAPDRTNLTRLANLLSGIVALGAPILGLIIANRQVRHRIGWLWIIYGLLIGLRSFGHGIFFLGGSQPSGYSALEYFFLWVTETANMSVLVCLILLLLWFPDGQLPSRRWRFLYFWLLLAFTALFMSNFEAGPNWNGGAEAGGIVIDNPYGWLSITPTHPIYYLGFPSFLSLLLMIILAAISLIFRYRSARQLVRLQLRWFLLGGFFSVILFLLPVPLAVSSDQNPGGFDYLAVLLGQTYVVPLYLAVGVAILRYRLFDIDVILRKTLQYAALTALLAIIYFGLIVLLETLFGRATGEQSPISIVLSTLLIAALFNPLRRRTQEVIDRRFFRRKYDAQQVLAKFARTARDETETDRLAAELEQVVGETLQPASLRIWLRNDRRNASRND